MNASRDELFSELASDIEAFRFDERVTRVFADMIRRSVPGYASVIAMTGVLGAEHIRPHSRVYDLGCSLGTSLMSIHSRVEVPCKLIGIDNSPAMISACRQNLDSLAKKPQIDTQLACADITETAISNASLVVMHYTLQFIEPDKRLDLLRKIHAGLNPGGILILSEKLNFKDPKMDAALTRLYYDFKKHNGYSELEISQKRQALENVLIPETEKTHLRRLNKAGFESAMSWFQCLNFHSFVAYKSAKKQA
ncbi:MAG: carboxy-S-adenosyl-L-methionine synthase CmoA [Proteobacteria bacterium]|nr:carboxy-S-adenosyl-L-methionine synthase CmoA [Pseudomonadota bacterium]